MRIDLSGAEPVIDVADLARALRLDPDRVQLLMRAGEITSTYEIGVGEDAGRHRLTFRHGDLRVRFTCNDSGEVLKTSRITSRPRP